ncbi:TraR/DksA family transcriptional regulator [bacterium]|nr:TraR/DksA family transcriptional regulator [bacterium]
MARKDALLRLRSRLIARRDALRKKLSLDKTGDGRGSGDLGDVACEGARNELNSQLATIETRELRFVERALQMLLDGTYGTCEQCGGSIPVSRLQALPYTVLCVKCQSDLEAIGDDEQAEIDWDMACDYEVRFSDQDVLPDDFHRGV